MSETNERAEAAREAIHDEIMAKRDEILERTIAIHENFARKMARVEETGEEIIRALDERMARLCAREEESEEMLRAIQERMARLNARDWRSTSREDLTDTDMSQSAAEVFSDDSSAGPSNSSSSHSARRAPLKESEWACVDAKCAYVNFESRDTCGKCDKDKPKVKSNAVQEIGKDFAEKSKGLFSPQDWACTKCGNVNWARRDVCNVCKTKKFGGNEVRTGYGGGFMDRQQVEYKSRREEEEFDEFGRKKPKKGASDDMEDGEMDDEDAKAEDRLSVENEEEEEDSDEADLGKYDLGSDDDFVSLKSTLAAKVASASANDGSRASTPCSCSCSENDTCSCDEQEEHHHKRDSRDDRSRCDRSQRNGRSDGRHSYDRGHDRHGSGRDTDRDRKRRHREDRSRDRHDYDRSSRDRDRKHRERNHRERRSDGKSRSRSPSPPHRKNRRH